MRYGVHVARWTIAATVMFASTVLVGGPVQAEVGTPYLTETYPAKEATSGTSGPVRAGGVAPFRGTVWISPDVLTPGDPTDLQSTEYVGIQQRRTFDRRSASWVVANMHIIKARYSCGLTSVDVIVNTEFSKEQAISEAQRFAEVHGRIPPGVRYAVNELWIHGGDELAGGGNSSVLIHTDFAAKHWPFIEELFLHEAAHTTLDYEAWGAGGVDRTSWEAAKLRDGRAISDYAHEFPDREDIAESYGAFALWKVAQAVNPLDRNARIIAETIPQRLAYLDSLGEEFVPRTEACPVVGPKALTNLKAATRGKLTTISWTPPNPLWGVSHYEWRVGSRANQLGRWQAHGNSKTSTLALQNSVRGRNWFVEVRAVWGTERGPAVRIRYRS